jgi:hypothetical protein
LFAPDTAQGESRAPARDVAIKDHGRV